MVDVRHQQQARSQSRAIETVRPQNDRKRKTDASRELDSVLHEHFGETQLKEFLHCHLTDGGIGAGPMVIRSFDQYGSVGGNWNPEEVEWELRSAHIYFGLSRGWRERIVSMVDHYYHRGRRHADHDMERRSTQTRHIIPPRDLNEVNTRYIRSGRSIAMNLPTPLMLKNVPGHACITLTECIKDLLAHGIRHECIPLVSRMAEGQSYDWITDTPRADEIRRSVGMAVEQAHLAGVEDRSIRMLPYIIWNDDFEANNSTKKKGSTWLQTVTLAPHRSSRNLQQQTYPLAIGKSRDNSHQPAENLLLGHMTGLMVRHTKMFSTRDVGSVAVIAAPYAIICDQPERRKMTRTMSTASTYHARFRYSINHKALLSVLRTCPSCLEAMRGTETTLGKLKDDCPSCVNWDADIRGKPTPTLGQLKLPLPPDYPTSGYGKEERLRGMYITDDNRILPFQLSSNRLKQSLELAFNNLVSGAWKNKEVHEFLSRECINTDMINQVQDNAANARALQAVNEDESQESDAVRELVRGEQRQKPHLYCCPEMPFSWDILGPGQDSLSLFVDVLMHLMFLGIVKSVLLRVKKWMQDQHLFEDFKVRGEKLSQILDELKLDWLPVLEFRNGTFGGWVSENFVAFSRIATWFFQEIPDLASNKEDFEPPSVRPNSAWKKGHYLHWLRVRGLPRKGTIPQLKERIVRLIDRPGGPPSVLVTVAGGVHSPPQVERALVAMEHLIAIVMTPTVEPGKTAAEMEFRIKHFLAEFDLLDQQIQTDPNIVKVFNCANFMCLLNLPSLTKRFGPLRNLWEGSWKGEGYIIPAKKFLHNGQRKDFEKKHAMERLLTDSSFRRSVGDGVHGEEQQTNSHGWDSFLSGRTGSFRTHRDKREIERKLECGRALSVVVCFRKNQGLSLLAFSQSPTECEGTPRKGRRACYVLNSLLEGEVKEKMGARYQEWLITAGPIDLEALPRAVGPLCDMRTTFGVLLPLLEKGAVPKHHLILHSRYSVHQHMAQAASLP